MVHMLAVLDSEKATEHFDLMFAIVQKKDFKGHHTCSPPVDKKRRRMLNLLLKDQSGDIL